MPRKKKIAFFTPSVMKYSESFIQAHITGLDGEIDVFHDGEMPKRKNGDVFHQPGIWDYRLQKLIGNAHYSIEQLALYRALRSGKYQLSFVEYGTTAARVFSTVQKLRIPLIVHFHGFDISVRNVIEKNRKVYQDIFNYASLIIVVSREMEMRAIALGCPSNKILYNPCGANGIFEKVVSKVNGNTFLCVGRFVEKKGPLYTIIAFHQLLLSGYKAYLKLIGDGPQKEMCEDYVKAHDISDWVTFLGVKKANEIAEEMSNATCYVQHSITASSGDQEGTPVSILEAMLAGLPVISTLHGGIKDVVGEDCGVLVPEKDAKAMFHAMQDCLIQPEKFQAMGAAAKKYILQNHTLELHLERMNSAIANL
jgi:colanic acid/amylovoran biosynthesis glycosyltransferase